MKTETFAEWSERTTIKNLDLTKLTKLQFFTALELAYNSGESNGINRLAKTLDEKSYLCPDCSEIKEDCVCLEKKLEESEYNKGWR